MKGKNFRKAGKWLTWFGVFTAIIVVSVQPAAALQPSRLFQVTEAPAPQGEAIISPLVKLLDQDALGLLRAVNDDGTYTFAGHTPALDSLAVGEIMIGTQSRLMPFGFQRKVTDIVFSNNEIIVRTIQAALDEAIVKADIGVEQPLTPENIFGAEQSPGLQLVSYIPRAAPDGFNLTLQNVVLTDGDGNPSTTDDQVAANGYINLKPAFSFKAKISDSQVNELNFFVNTEEEARLEVSSTIDFLGPLLPDPVRIARYYFNPITIMVGWLPVLLTPELTVYVGMDGKVSASITTGVTQRAFITSGVEYLGGNWNGISPMEGFQPEAFDFYGPTFKAECQLKVFVRPQVQLMIYSVVGPAGSVDGFLELDIDPATLDWQLYDGVKIKVGVKIEVISHVLAEYSNTVYERKWFLDGSTPPQPPTASPTEIIPTATPPPDHGNGGWSCWTWGLVIGGVLLLLYFLGSRKK